MTNSSPADNFSIVWSQDTAIMAMPDRLSVLEAVAFKQNYQQLLESSPTPQKIILDFQATRFMDSSGVGALVSNFKVTQAQGYQVLLENVNPPVMAVFILTSLDRLFCIETEKTTNTQTTPNKNLI
jgi:anti-anti-sigma factor